MNLEAIKNFSEKRSGGLKRLAADIGMSEQNLHRCIRNNKIQAADLEKISHILEIDIRVFFDAPPEEVTENTVETNGSVAVSDNATAHHISTNVVSGGDAIQSERIKCLEALLHEKDIRISEKDTLLAEKERVIRVYERALGK